MDNQKIKKISVITLAIILLIAGIYLLAFPLFPKLTFFAKKTFKLTNKIAYETNLTTEENSATEIKPIPEKNTLVIPQIDIDTPIFEGNIGEFSDGVWRRPNSSTPEKGSNMVLTSHRFQYSPTSQNFYHLDKLEVGDRFLIFWNKIEYDYEIFEKKIVSPQTTEIENPTDDSIITLYTCTPILTAKNRLVIKARLLE